MIGTTGSSGEQDEQFYHPRGIVYDEKHKRILVAGQGNNRIQVLNATDGKFVSKFGTQGNGNGQFYTPRGICLHPSNNNIIVAEVSNNRVQMLNDQFQFVSMIGNNFLKEPWAVDCSSLPPHSIVAADYSNQIHIFSPSSNNNNNNNDYQLVRSFCSNGSSYNQTNGVFGICFDDEHKQIVVCDVNNRNRWLGWISSCFL